MSQQIDSCHIRFARADEVLRFHDIEDAAGEMFSGLDLINEGPDGSFPLEELARLIQMGQVWTACMENDLPIGMVIASVRGEIVHVEELDVLPEHGRRGIGGRLLETVCSWAESEGRASVTLSTFRDVPWNGPFYRKHDFLDLSPDEWMPWMHTLREKETQLGLRVEERVFMRRELDK